MVIFALTITVLFTAYMLYCAYIDREYTSDPEEQRQVDIAFAVFFAIFSINILALLSLYGG